MCAEIETKPSKRQMSYLFSSPHPEGVPSFRSCWDRGSQRHSPWAAVENAFAPCPLFCPTAERCGFGLCPHRLWRVSGQLSVRVEKQAAGGLRYDLG